MMDMGPPELHCEHPGGGEDEDSYKFLASQQYTGPIILRPYSGKDKEGPPRCATGYCRSSTMSGSGGGGGGGGEEMVEERRWKLPTGSTDGPTLWWTIPLTIEVRGKINTILPMMSGG